MNEWTWQFQAEAKIIRPMTKKNVSSNFQVQMFVIDFLQLLKLKSFLLRN